MDIRASLATLSASSGPSGREQKTLERAMELLRPLVDEVSRNRFGNLIGVRRCGKENAKRVVLDAHLDEVGWSLPEPRTVFCASARWVVSTLECYRIGK